MHDVQVEEFLERVTISVAVIVPGATKSGTWRRCSQRIAGQAQFIKVEAGSGASPLFTRFTSAMHFIFALLSSPRYTCRVSEVAIDRINQSTAPSVEMTMPPVADECSICKAVQQRTKLLRTTFRESCRYDPAEGEYCRSSTRDRSAHRATPRPSRAPTGYFIAIVGRVVPAILLPVCLRARTIRAA